MILGKSFDPLEPLLPPLSEGQIVVENPDLYNMGNEDKSFKQKRSVNKRESFIMGILSEII